jgi:hypothetical protein
MEMSPYRGRLGKLDRLRHLLCNLLLSISLVSDNAEATTCLVDFDFCFSSVQEMLGTF